MVKRRFQEYEFKTEGYSLKNTRGKPDLDETYRVFRPSIKKTGSVMIDDSEFKDWRKHIHPSEGFAVMIRRTKKKKTR